MRKTHRKGPVPNGNLRRGLAGNGDNSAFAWLYEGEAAVCVVWIFEVRTGRELLFVPRTSFLERAHRLAVRTITAVKRSWQKAKRSSTVLWYDKAHLLQKSHSKRLETFTSRSELKRHLAFFFYFSPPELEERGMFLAKVCLSKQKWNTVFWTPYRSANRHWKRYIKRNKKASITPKGFRGVIKGNHRFE